MILKLIITIVLVVPYLIGLEIGYTDNSGFVEHLSFPFCHANVFHLLCNLIAIWAIRGNLNIIPALVINFIASYLPQPPTFTLPTMGASGVVFTMIGIQWGAYFTREYFKPIIECNMDMLEKNAKRFFIFVFLPMTAMIIIPNINYALHLYTLFLGMLYAFFTYLIKH